MSTITENVIQAIHNFSNLPKEEIKRLLQKTLTIYPKIELKQTRNKNWLVLTTKNINIKHNNKKYSIGVFKVYINLTRTKKIYNQVEYRNTNKKKIKLGMFFHPHIIVGRKIQDTISTSGYACHGNITELLAKMLFNGNIFAAIKIIDNFLHSYNEHGIFNRNSRLASKIELWKEK